MNRATSDPKEAAELLARHLHWTMERFDHSEPEEDWDAMTPDDQEFYRACVRELLREREMIITAVWSAVASDGDQR